MRKLDREILNHIKEYKKPMRFQGLVGAFLEEYDELSVKEAVWRLIDQKDIELTSDRKLMLVVSKDVVHEAEKNALKFVEDRGGVSVKDAVDSLSDGDDRKEVMYRDIMRRLIESNKVYVGEDWKVRT